MTDASVHNGNIDHCRRDLGGRRADRSRRGGCQEGFGQVARNLGAGCDGKKFTEEEVKKTKLFIKGETFRIPESSVATSEDGTINIDLSKKPKEMNATTGSGPDKGKTWQGIYELAADKYKACFAPPGKDRPTEFSSKAGSGHLLQLWKREKE